MRDPARIDTFVAALADLWRQKPDLRFGQVIEHIVPASVGDTYYTEDDEWLRWIDVLRERARAEAPR